MDLEELMQNINNSSDVTTIIYKNKFKIYCDRIGKQYHSLLLYHNESHIMTICLDYFNLELQDEITNIDDGKKRYICKLVEVEDYIVNNMMYRRARQSACKKENNETVVTNINRVADYFTSQIEVSPRKLQRLCYYAYAWHLAMHGERLFNEQFEGWVHGAVNPQLYDRYKKVINGYIEKTEKPQFSEGIEQFLDTVINTYGKYIAQELDSMICSEDPWLESRKGLSSTQAGYVPLNDETIKEYYIKLYKDNN